MNSCGKKVGFHHVWYGHPADDGGRKHAYGDGVADAREGCEVRNHIHRHHRGGKEGRDQGKEERKSQGRREAGN